MKVLYLNGPFMADVDGFDSLHTDEEKKPAMVTMLDTMRKSNAEKKDAFKKLLSESSTFGAELSQAYWEKGTDPNLVVGCIQKYADEIKSMTEKQLYGLGAMIESAYPKGVPNTPESKKASEILDLLGAERERSIAESAEEFLGFKSLKSNGLDYSSSLVRKIGPLIDLSLKSGSFEVAEEVYWHALKLINKEQRAGGWGNYDSAWNAHGSFLYDLIDDVDKEYIGYLLKNRHFQKYIDSNATGTTIKNVSLQTIRSYEFELPPKKNQQDVSNFLSSLDQKIKLNKKMNENLEEIAKTLFKSWFIDFDPVRAKAEGRSTGLSKEISDLFPDSFEDSELGEIPKGWKIKDIKDVCNTTDYVANGSFKTLKDNVKRVDSNVKDSAILVRVTDHNSNWNGEFKYIDESSYNFLKKSKLFPGDIVICNVADVGKCFMVPDLGRKMSLGPNSILCKDFKEFETVSKEYFFYFINTPGTQNLLSSISSGSVQNKFNKTQFRSLQMLVPSKKLIQSFDEVCKNIIEMKDLKNKENQILTDLRDTLLPKLISGELRIPDVEKLVDEARV